VLEADASILVDNSRTVEQAFTLCRAQMKEQILFDLQHRPPEIEAWMNKICPL
jgi:hypothetical protein